jgi:hypothetical protein
MASPHIHIASTIVTANSIIFIFARKLNSLLSSLLYRDVMASLPIIIFRVISILALRLTFV